MKIFFRRIHLYLSLAAGVVIFIACLTGALLVFQKELELGFYKHRYFANSQGSRLSIDSLVGMVKQTYPRAKVTAVKVYSNPERNVEVNLSLAGKQAPGGMVQQNTAAVQQRDNQGSERAGAGRREGPAAEKPREGGRAPGVTAFVNPYSGQIQELYNSRESFFFKVMSLHRWLLGSNDGIGKYIVGISTFIFLFILLTGIILWWPKTRNILRQRLRIKSDAGWKRINHDLHLVLGFYCAIFLFVFSFTALPMSFQWFNKGIFTVTKSPMKNPEPPKSTFIASARPVGFDAALQSAAVVLPEVHFYTVTVPNDSLGAVSVSALSKHAVHETAPDAIYLDQYSGEVIGTQFYKDRTLGARVRSTFRPVHVSSIWGLPSKIIGLIVCLLGATFPVTGVIMWLNRTRKKKTSRRTPAASVTESELVD